MSEELKKDEQIKEEAGEVVETSVEEASVEETADQTSAPVKIKNNMADIEKALLEAENNQGKFPEFSVGDTVRVHVKIKEGNKERIQPYEGVVMAFKHGGNRRTFMVRRVSAGVAIERVFPFHSPFLDKVDVIRHGRVRRAKLYYLRGRFGKSAKIREKVRRHTK